MWKNWQQNIKENRQDQKTPSLQDVMSEQLAQKLTKDQSKKEDRELPENEITNTTPSSHDPNFDDAEIQRAIDMSLKECSIQTSVAQDTNNNDEHNENNVDITNDALLAKLLQKQLDQEYNLELSQTQNKLNSQSKINYNFEKYKIDFSSDDSENEVESNNKEEILSESFNLKFIYPQHQSNSPTSSPRSSRRNKRRKRPSETSNNACIAILTDKDGPTIQQQFNSEDDECPEVYEDCFRPKKLVGREERFDTERNEWINKHDIIEGNKTNALKLDSFPLQCKTGNMKDLSLSNKIYNDLKTHAFDQKRQAARLHEEKEKSTAEHAVDKRTRLILHKFVNAGTLEEINGVISIGKEAVVLHAKGGTFTPLNQNDLHKPIPENIAIKVFKTVMSEFKNRDKYIADDYRFQERFKKINHKKLAYLWAEKEMRNLERLNTAGIACPEVVLLRKHILMMRFIGTTSETGGSVGSAAPKLSEYLIRPEVDLPTQVRAYKQTVEIMKKMYTSARLVHADLSAYNLLWHENKVWVIDTAQAVEPQHPKALEFLYRDCLNICKFFGGKLKIKQVPNPRKLFFEVCDVPMEGVEIDDCSFQSFDPSSKENAEFFSKLEELQLRAQVRVQTRKGVDWIDQI